MKTLIEDKFWVPLERLNRIFRADRKIMLMAIDRHKEALRFADDSLKEDKTFILDALRVNPNVYDELWKIDEKLEKDEEILAFMEKL